MLRALRRLLIVGGVALACLLAPAVALADGTYTWSMPGDFTTSGSGANPDHDRYGGTPWSYLEGSTALPQFSSSVDGGLAGWQDPSSGAFVADNTGGSTVTGTTGDSWPAGQIALYAAGGKAVSLRWTAPVSGTVTVTSSFAVADPSAALDCALSNASVTLEHNGTAVPSGTTQVSVAAGDTLDVVVTPNTAPLVSAKCNGYTGTLTLTAPATTPAVTLASPGSAPLSTSTPTLSGTASTAYGASEVAVAIYSGPSVTGSPTQTMATAVRSDGTFSVTPTTLPDGQYTAVAGQSSPGGLGVSPPVTFSIKLNPPALTLTTPAVGGSAPRTSVVIAGAAGNTFGDSSQIQVTLYSGTTTSGTKVGTQTATRSGSGWALIWPGTLAVGFYTVQASQSDDAGHTTVTPAHTFLVVAPPNPLGAKVTLTHGRVSMSVGCAAPSDETCAIKVRVLTVHSYKPNAAAPKGRLLLLYATVHLAGGQSTVVSHRVSGAVAHLLSTHPGISVHVDAQISFPGSVTTPSVTRRLTVSGAKSHHRRHKHR